MIFSYPIFGFGVQFYLVTKYTHAMFEIKNKDIQCIAKYQ
jgi:hypothetical protein